MNSCKDNRGFSLVELAIVIMIIGLLFALGLKMLSPLVQRLKHTDTKEGIEAAYEAVIGYAAMNNRLPGVNEFGDLVKSTDVWGNDLIYRPADELLADNTVCERSTTKLRVNDDGNLVSNVAFLILSRGANQNIQTNVYDTIQTSQTQVTIKTYLFDTYDTSGIDDFSGSTTWPDPVGTRLEYYKDIVKYITLSDLRIKAGCEGEELSILNRSLVACAGADANFEYSETIYATGGIPFADDSDSFSPPKGSSDSDDDPDYQWCITGTDPLPDGIEFECGGSLIPGAASCELGSDTGWTQCTYPVVDSSNNEPYESGSFQVTFWVRDNNDSTGTDDNITSKTYVLTIDPFCVECQANGLPLTNNTGNTISYKKNGESCQILLDGGSTTVTTADSFEFYNNVACTTPASCSSIDYSDLKDGYDAGDAGGDDDCRVQLTAITAGSCTWADD
jgi:prepilin-type N-terminal cleavage/methylation domain-containing protein